MKKDQQRSRAKEKVRDKKENERLGEESKRARFKQ